MSNNTIQPKPTTSREPSPLRKHLMREIAAGRGTPWKKLALAKLNHAAKKAQRPTYSAN